MEVWRMTFLPQTTCSELLRWPGPELSGFLRGDQLGNGAGGRRAFGEGTHERPIGGLSCTSTAPPRGPQSPSPASVSSPLDPTALLPLTLGPLPCRLSWNLLGDEAAAELARVLPQMGRLKRVEYEGHSLGGRRGLGVGARAGPTSWGKPRGRWVRTLPSRKPSWTYTHRSAPSRCQA